MLELVTYNLGSKNQFHQIVKSRNSKPVFQTQDPSPLQCNCLSLTGQCVLGEAASSIEGDLICEPAG